MTSQNSGAASAAILAGGLGSRLRSVVSDRPKVLALVNGRPFIAALLDQIVESGAESVALCTGYLGEQVEAAFGAVYRNLKIFYSREPSSLGTAGALRLALPLLGAGSIVVMNGDSFCDARVKDVLSWHRARAARATLLLSEVADTSRYGRVRTADDGRVVGFEEKDASGGRGWINAGVYVIERELLETIPGDRAVSLEREMFSSWIGEGMYGFKTSGRFIDIGIPETYAAAGRFFSSEAKI
ncbi:MAG TPA: nucleotidyltransferase family protein [Chthoniobacterales bacterium]|jgi:NDP-sugar pyrophosphorylase family protein